jgi:hypothetical protein
MENFMITTKKPSPRENRRRDLHDFDLGFKGSYEHPKKRKDCHDDKHRKTNEKEIVRAIIFSYFCALFHHFPPQSFLSICICSAVRIKTITNNTIAAADALPIECREKLCW